MNEYSFFKRAFKISFFFLFFTGIFFNTILSQTKLEFADFTTKGMNSIRCSGDDIFIKYISKNTGKYKTSRISLNDFTVTKEYNEDSPASTCTMMDGFGARILNNDQLEIYDLANDSLLLKSGLNPEQQDSIIYSKYIYNGIDEKCYVFVLYKKASTGSVLIYDASKNIIDKKILPAFRDSMKICEILSTRITNQKVICRTRNINDANTAAYAIYDLQTDAFIPIEIPPSEGYTTKVTVFDFESSSAIMLHLCKPNDKSVVTSVKKVVFKLDHSTAQLEFMNEFKSNEEHVESNTFIVPNEYGFDYSRLRSSAPFEYITYNIGAGGYFSIIKISSNLVKEISFDVNIEEVEEYLLRQDILYVRARSKGKMRELQIDIRQEQLICNEEGNGHSTSSLNYPAKTSDRIYVNWNGADRPLGYEFKRSVLTLYKPE